MKINQIESYIEQQSKQEFVDSELIKLSEEIKKLNNEFENYEIQKKYFDAIYETVSNEDEFILSLATLDKSISIPLINSTEKFQNLANYFKEKYGEITFNFLKIPYFVSKFNLKKNSDEATLELYKAMFWNGDIQKFYNQEKNNINNVFFNYFQQAYLRTEKKIKTFKWLYENHKKILKKDPGSIYDSYLLWITESAKYATEFHFDTLDFLIENLDKEHYGFGYPEINYRKGTRLLQIVFEQLNIFLDTLEYIAPSKNYKEKIKEFKFYKNLSKKEKYD